MRAKEKVEAIVNSFDGLSDADQAGLVLDLYQRVRNRRLREIDEKIYTTKYPSIETNLVQHH